MDAAFQEAVAPKPHAVLGLKLQPLTIGHRFLLQKHGSAYITGGPIDMWELILAVLICSLPYGQAKRISPSGFSLRLFVWFWTRRMKRDKNLILEIEHQKFDRYWASSHQAPEVIIEHNSNALIAGPKTFGSPFDIRALAMLEEQFHMSPEEARNTPIVEAAALWAARGETKGELTIYNGSRLDALWQFAKEQDAEWMAKKKN